jgi:cytochrome c-type biogenesis protein CcmH/NrfF
MLIDALMNPRLQGTEKLVWVLVVLFLHLLGAVLYFAIGREQRLV